MNQLPENSSTSRRKRPRDAGETAEEKRAQQRRHDEDVTEEEVEEFFAILFRTRQLMRCSAEELGRQDRSSVTTASEKEKQRCPAWRWRPVFELEDFQKASCDTGRTTAAAEKKVETAAIEDPPEENQIRHHFDLNVEPAGEEVAVRAGSGKCVFMDGDLTSQQV